MDVPAHYKYTALLVSDLISFAHLRSLKGHTRSTDAMSMQCDQLDRGSMVQRNSVAS